MAELNMIDEHTDVDELLDPVEQIDPDEEVEAEAWVPDIGDEVAITNEYYPGREVRGTYEVLSINPGTGTVEIVDSRGEVRTVDRFEIARTTPGSDRGIESDPTSSDYARRLRIRLAERGLSLPDADELTPELTQGVDRG